MNPLLKLVARYVRDLLCHDEQMIKIGRHGETREDFELPYIVIDQTGPARQIGSMSKFDGDAEKVSLGSIADSEITIDFYGNDAYDLASKFNLMTRSQKALELRRGLKITPHHPKSLIDLRSLTGQQYGGRVQVAMNVTHSTSISIDTLRIETVEVITQTEQGIE